MGRWLLAFLIGLVVGLFYPRTAPPPVTQTVTASCPEPPKCPVAPACTADANLVRSMEIYQDSTVKCFVDLERERETLAGCRVDNLNLRGEAEDWRRKYYEQ